MQWFGKIEEKDAKYVKVAHRGYGGACSTISRCPHISGCLTVVWCSELLDRIFVWIVAFPFRRRSHSPT